MIKHIVVWEMKEGVDLSQKEEMKLQLEGLINKVSELKKIEVGIDVANNTMSLFSEFDSNEDLAIYQDHPEHQKVVLLVKSLVSSRTVCDYAGA